MPRLMHRVEPKEMSDWIDVKTLGDYIDSEIANQWANLINDSEHSIDPMLHFGSHYPSEGRSNTEVDLVFPDFNSAHIRFDLVEETLLSHFEDPGEYLPKGDDSDLIRMDALINTFQEIADRLVDARRNYVAHQNRKAK